MRSTPLLALFATTFAFGCIDDELEPELGTTEQRIVPSCAKTGLYDATKSQPWNGKGATVFDVRRCDTAEYLDGTFVAQQVGFIQPGFPNATNPGEDGSYRVFFPDAAHSNGKLLIYIPGSGASVAGKEELLQRAAYDGYHVIAIRYWNTDPSDVSMCGKNKHGAGSATDKYTFDTLPSYDTCVIRMYFNRFTNWGKPYSPAIKLAANGSTKCYEDAAENNAATFSCPGTPEGNALTDGDPVLFRTRALLKYLVSTRPASEKWDTFRAPGNTDYQTPPYLDWERVALMGHSTGSKILFHVAHDGPAGIANAAASVKFDRVIFLSGPNLGDSVPAGLTSYVHSPGKTPFDRIYAFSNIYDGNVDEARETWATMSGPATAGSSTILTGLPHPAFSYPQFDTHRGCSTTSGDPECHVCNEFRPAPPSPGSSYRALIYTGDVHRCVTDGTTASFDVDAHTSTTSDNSCRDPNKPNTCWYRDIWDFMLTNPNP